MSFLLRAAKSLRDWIFPPKKEVEYVLSFDLFIAWSGGRRSMAMERKHIVYRFKDMAGNVPDVNNNNAVFDFTRHLAKYFIFPRYAEDVANPDYIEYDHIENIRLEVSEQHTAAQSGWRLGDFIVAAWNTPGITFCPDPNKYQKVSEYKCAANLLLELYSRERNPGKKWAINLSDRTRFAQLMGLKDEADLMKECSAQCIATFCGKIGAGYYIYDADMKIIEKRVIDSNAKNRSDHRAPILMGMILNRHLYLIEDKEMRKSVANSGRIDFQAVRKLVKKDRPVLMISPNITIDDVIAHKDQDGALIYSKIAGDINDLFIGVVKALNVIPGCGRNPFPNVDGRGICEFSIGDMHVIRNDSYEIARDIAQLYTIPAGDVPLAKYAASAGFPIDGITPSLTIEGVAKRVIDDYLSRLPEYVRSSYEPSAREFIEAPLRAKNIEFVKDPENYLQIDERGAYAKALYFNTEPYYCFTPLDEIKEYAEVPTAGGIRAGLYYVETNDRTLFYAPPDDNYLKFEFFASQYISGPYPANIIREAMKAGIAHTIRYVIYPSRTIAADTFKPLMERVYKLPYNLAKHLMTVMTGALGRKQKTKYTARFTTDPNEAEYYRLKSSSDFFTSHKISDEKIMYEVSDVIHKELRANTVPIYNQIIANCHLSLFKTIQKLPRESVKAIRTDCIFIERSDGVAASIERMREDGEICDCKGGGCANIWKHLYKFDHTSMMRAPTEIKYATPITPPMQWKPAVIMGRDTNYSSIIELVKRRESMYFNAPAGYGKTYAINYIRSQLPISSDNTTMRPVASVAALSFTNMGALNIDGQTLHSYLGVPVGKEAPAKTLAKKFAALDMIIVDEVSMMPSYMYTTLMLAKRNNPNIVFIFAGDFSQITAINDIAAIARADQSRVFRWICDRNMIKFTHNFRQTVNSARIVDGIMGRNDVAVRLELYEGALPERAISYLHLTRRAYNQKMNAAVVELVGADECPLVAWDEGNYYIHEDMPIYAGKTMTDKSYCNNERFIMKGVNAKGNYVLESSRPPIMHRIVVPLAIILKHFLPGYCATIIKSQGLTINEPYIIYDLFDTKSSFFAANEKGHSYQYSAVSRCVKIEDVVVHREGRYYKFAEVPKDEAAINGLLVTNPGREWFRKEADYLAAPPNSRRPIRVAREYIGSDGMSKFAYRGTSIEELQSMITLPIGERNFYERYTARSPVFDIDYAVEGLFGISLIEGEKAARILDATLREISMAMLYWWGTDFDDIKFAISSSSGRTSSGYKYSYHIVVRSHAFAAECTTVDYKIFYRTVVGAVAAQFPNEQIGKIIDSGPMCQKVAQLRLLRCAKVTRDMNLCREKVPLTSYISFSADGNYDRINLPVTTLVDHMPGRIEGRAPLAPIAPIVTANPEMAALYGVGPREGVMGMALDDKKIKSFIESLMAVDINNSALGFHRWRKIVLATANYFSRSNTGENNGLSIIKQWMSDYRGCDEVDVEDLYENADPALDGDSSVVHMLQRLPISLLKQTWK